jgi:hypothetical protein
MCVLLTQNIPMLLLLLLRLACICISDGAVIYHKIITMYHVNPRAVLPPVTP